MTMFNFYDPSALILLLWAFWAAIPLLCVSNVLNCLDWVDMEEAFACEDWVGRYVCGNVNGERQDERTYFEPPPATA